MSGREDDRAPHSTGPISMGPLSFDPGSGDLTGPVGVERIAPQPASLLALLAARSGEVVTRDEVRERLWPGGKVEFEQGIAFAVREVRKAIDAVGGDPALVETIPKRGFRLVVPREPTTDTLPERGIARAAAPRRVDSPRMLVLPVAVVLVVAVVGLRLALSSGPTDAVPSVIVFAHDFEEETHAEMARALGFELTTALTRSLGGRLGVVGPTGTARLEGPDDTEGARATLGACLVVSGGIRATGVDSVVVFTQVVRASDRVHVWANLDTTAVGEVAATVVPRVVEGVESATRAC